MGNCGSCKSKSKATAKLVHLDGELEEFFSPIKVSNLENSAATTFICNSDEMEFDEYVTALGDNDQLLLGKLYFELPMNWLTQRLQAEDMANLAVKAIEAIKTSGGKSSCGFCRMKNDPLMFFHEGENVKYSRLHDHKEACKQNKFTANLSVILEE
ncbi:uncharacterized protein LOC132048744 [Lycium ferocissimum]|uniref:uncharacterized protein LOC132048744 n=1 Tax=Lycium ferocissimum TaxID=112874 RepID=UPI002816032D|nr:uncharacterized protein LOC132048744 [Lycium ferocissimum]